MKDKKIPIITALVVLIYLSPVAYSANSERGELLYKNHCHACHDSNAHIRTRKAAESKIDIYYQFHRWSKHLNLRWAHEDILDVIEYLNNTYYQY